MHLNSEVFFDIPPSQVWLVIAAVLQNFDITKKKDVDGKEIPINEGYSNGFVM